MSLRLPDRATQHEPFANKLRNSVCSARAVRHLARVVLVVEFCKIKGQIFAADMVMRSIKRTFGISKKSFSRVCAGKPTGLIATRIFLLTMIHCVVRRKPFSCFVIERRFVGVEMGRLGNVFLE